MPAPRRALPRPGPADSGLAAAVTRPRGPHSPGATRPSQPETSRPPGGHGSRAVTRRQCSHALRLAAQHAIPHCDGGPGRSGQRLERNRHGRAGQAGLDETGHLGALPLVLAAPGPDRVVTAPGPDRGLAEVVQPRAAAAAGGVERLLGEAGVAAGEVADHAAGAVAE